MSSLKKILVINEFFPPDFAATGQLLEDLLVSLEASQEKFKLEVFTSKPSYAFDCYNNHVSSREISQGILIKRSNSFNIFSQRIRLKALKSILFTVRSFFFVINNSYKYELLVLTTAPPFLPWLGIIANLLFNKPYICIVYDLYPNVLTTLGVMPESSWLIKFWRKLNGIAWHRASRIIVLDSSMKQNFLNADYKLEDTKISTIYNWADEKFILPREKKYNWFAQQHDIVDRFTVIYSGNMGRCHDMKTIVEAAQLLKSEKILFLMIGGGAKAYFILQKKEELNLDNICLLPFQKKDVLPYSLTAGNLNLISIDEQMSGLVSPSKLYGALAAGKPIVVIGPQESFLCSLIAEANCGQFFKNGQSQELAEFILHLSKNPHLSKTMGDASRAYFLSHFTKSHALEKYMRVIDSVLGMDMVSSDESV